MSIRLVRRLCAVAAIVVVLLAVSASPALATLAGIKLKPSTYITIKTPTGTILATYHIVEHPTTNVCASNSGIPLPIPLELPSNGTGTVGASTTAFNDFTIGANTYKMRMVVTGGSMTLSSTGVSLTLTTRMEFRTCDSTTTLCLTNLYSITLTGANPTGTHHPPESTDLPSQGSQHITVPFNCNAVIRAAFNSNIAEYQGEYHITG